MPHPYKTVSKTAFRMKIIYVTPHLSTGGMPEYLRRKVEILKDEHDVWVVEKHFEQAYRTIRDKIEHMLGDRLITIGDRHHLLLDIIETVKPDVVHFEELSDYSRLPTESMAATSVVMRMSPRCATFASNRQDDGVDGHTQAT